MVHVEAIPSSDITSTYYNFKVYICITKDKDLLLINTTCTVMDKMDGFNVSGVWYAFYF